MKLLIVDDELWSRKLIAKLLDWNTYGFTVIFEAEDGKAAIKKIEEDSIDLVITDMRMPGIDGAMLLDYISKKNLNIEVIVMSGYEDYKYLHSALKIKAIDYLLKPVVKSELHAAVITGINRITKNENNNYLAEILRRQDLKDDFNKFYETKLLLISSVKNASEQDVIFYANQLYKDFFNNNTKDINFTSFILDNIKREIIELEHDCGIGLNYDVVLVPETIIDRLLLICKHISSNAESRKISILEIQKYINSHISETMSLQDISKRYYVSKEHLSRLFKKETGVSVQKYINDKKIEYAKNLLRNHSTIAMSTVSVLCGFMDMHYFYRVFKNTTGLTPKQYQEQNQNHPINTSILSK